MNHKTIERLLELQQDYDNAVSKENLSLAEQLCMEINYILEENDEVIENGIG